MFRKPQNSPQLAVALGGGGSRGNAHIGVLRVLERDGIRPVAIAGTSAGGLVAVFYAAGYSPDEIEDIFANADPDTFFGRTRGEEPALFGLTKAEAFLREHLGERTFADLKIPCAVTAVDVDTAREVILMEGSLVNALLATIAIPGVFPPRIMDGHRLVDGGVLDPVPVSVARILAPDFPVLAVVLTPRPDQNGRTWALPSTTSSLTHQVVERLSRLRVAQALNIFMESVDIANRAMSDLRLQLDAPEIIIRPPVSHIGTLETVDVRAIARLGEQAALQALPQIRTLLRPPLWMRFWKMRA